MTRFSIVLLTLWAAQAMAADWARFEHDFEDESKPWQEIQAQLPASAKPDRLHSFEVSRLNRHRHYLDLASLSAGEDGVVRYTVLVRTEGGAENISYEGMRCETGERKIYAFGRPDGTWSRNKYARWDPIETRRETSYHRELFFHYFCTVDGAANLKVIRHAIENGGIRRGGDY
jgi:hypothetical protein